MPRIEDEDWEAGCGVRSRPDSGQGSLMWRGGHALPRQGQKPLKARTGFEPVYEALQASA